MKTWCVPKHGYRPDITYMSVLSPRRAPSKHGVTISMGSTSLQCHILNFKNLLLGQQGLIDWSLLFFMWWLLKEPFVI